MTEFKPRSLKRLVGGLAGLFVVSLLFGFGVGVMSVLRPDWGGGVVFVAFGVGAAILMAAAVAVGVGWMRSIDEAAQEAHKSAWYWGGSVGLAIGGAFAIVASLPQAADWAVPSLVAGRADPAAYAATGALMLLALMIAGYGIAWAVWWLRRR